VVIGLEHKQKYRPLKEGNMKKIIFIILLGTCCDIYFGTAVVQSPARQRQLCYGMGPGMMGGYGGYGMGPGNDGRRLD